MRPTNKTKNFCVLVCVSANHRTLIVSPLNQLYLYISKETFSLKTIQFRL